MFRFSCEKRKLTFFQWVVGGAEWPLAVVLCWGEAKSRIRAEVFRHCGKRFGSHDHDKKPAGKKPLDKHPWIKNPSTKIQFIDINIGTAGPLDYIETMISEFFDMNWPDPSDDFFDEHPIVGSTVMFMGYVTNHIGLFQVKKKLVVTRFNVLIPAICCKIKNWGTYWLLW